MQTTTASYNAYSDARWVDLRASFRLVDTGAYTDATAAASASETISQLTQTHDATESMGNKWATLETSGWPLDGTMQIMPDSVTGEQTGWWSGLSGEDGTFAAPPTLTFSFTSNHTSVGFTIIFDDKANIYPKEIVVAAYDSSDVLIDNLTLNCTSATQVVNLLVTNYQKIIITFNSTQEGYQRVRVSEVIFGIVQYFDKDNIKNSSLLYELSPMAEALPSRELTITFDNSDAKYNMLSPSSVYTYLQQGQEIDVEFGVGSSKTGLEYVNMGKFYFTKSEAQDASLTAKITAYDKFYQLEKSICRIGTTGTDTVTNLVAAVVADSGLSITTEIPSVTGALTINKCIPSTATHREAFRLIAQAAMTTCYFNREGVLVFKEITAGTSADTLDNDNMAAVAKVSITDRVNTVELTVNNEFAETENIYTASDVTAGETAQLLSVNNPLGNQDTADWLLVMAQRRVIYDLIERGNPARETTDTITIYDAYNVNGDAVIIKEDFIYKGGLTCSTRGWA